MTRSRNNRTPGKRQLRVGEEVRHALARVLARGELRDPDLRDVSVTVSEVRISPDLRNATAWIMPLGGDGAETVVRALRRAAPFLRGQIGHEVELRHLPALHFEIDTSFGQAARIDEILYADGRDPED